MSSQIIVPALGESVSEATVAKWFKNVGESVQKDEILVELETDKVTLEINAQVSGVVTEIKVPENDNVEVGAILGSIKEGAVAENKPAAQEIAAPQQAVTETPVTKLDGSGPAARKLVAENNIDPANISGTGKDGRITKGDVLGAILHTSPPACGGGNGGGPSETKNTIENREERVRMTKLRQVIAKRLKDSQNTAAILTTFNEIDMTNVMALRKEYQDTFVKNHDVKLGFMSFFTKAAIAALKELPDVNAEISGNEIIYKNYYDIGIAVGSAQGLVVPVIRDADKLSFSGIEKTLVELGTKAKNGKLSMAELTGGTFTISNGGVYGSLLSTPIINPPQSAILGLHKIEKRPVVVGNDIKIRPMMYTALSYDHRIIDGREAVTFLVRIKECIEDPRRLLLEI